MISAILALLQTIGRVLTDQPDPKAPLLAVVPPEWQSWVSVFLSIVPIFMVFPLLFALTTVVERKGLGRIQNRRGPNRVGPAGFLQFAADGLKTLTKEDVVPRAADRVVHFLAPLVLVIPVFLTFSVLPFGKHLVPMRMETGLMFFFAIGAVTELAVFMAGWASRNKYSLLGAMRAIAQMISYEVPLVVSALAVVLTVGTLSLPEIAEAQAGKAGEWLAPWHCFTPWGFVGFWLFLISACAEANRSPFDLPEGESEIIAGYYLEYSGFKFALFFLGEYLGLFAASGLAITLFLGGWSSPFPALNPWVPSWVWFFGKLIVLIAFFIWVRGTLPRLRMDQLMNLAWKFMIPMTLVNLLVAGSWKFISSPAVKWGLGILVLGLAYWGMGKLLLPAKKIGSRVYRFAS